MTATLSRQASRSQRARDQPGAGGRAGVRAESSAGHRGRCPARLVLDTQFVLDEVIAHLIRGELARGGTLQVVLVPPRLGWSIDAVVVALRRRRIIQAREQQIEGLLRIAGDRSAQVTIAVRRSWWRRRPRPATSRSEPRLLSDRKQP